MAVIQLRYRYGVWWDAEDCCVEDVFVRAEARGYGPRQGARVVRHRPRPRARLPPLELDTGEDNAPAQGLYRSLGFRPAGVFIRRPIDENVPRAGAQR